MACMAFSLITRQRTSQVDRLDEAQLQVGTARETLDSGAS